MERERERKAGGANERYSNIEGARKRQTNKTAFALILYLITLRCCLELMMCRVRENKMHLIG